MFVIFQLQALETLGWNGGDMRRVLFVIIEPSPPFFILLNKPLPPHASYTHGYIAYFA